MRRIMKHHQILAAVMTVMLLFTVAPIPVMADGDTIEIHTVADFMEFAENCKTDGWSIGKVVVLKNDLDISGFSFDGIPYFNGTFRGCGYTISCLGMESVGSHYGFFRYIGSLGIVRDLNVHGSIAPTGSASGIGGIAGVNRGMIIHCSCTGNVRGKTEVGGIVGYNAETGMILNSTNYAMILATDQTGGIAGRNEGLIADCDNQGNINTRELDTTMDLGGVDIGTLNLTGNIVNRNNMGGIAGMSEGTVTGCRNSGTIGFEHTGYNVGGIVGSQNGQIFDCTNEGTVYGRKDVGGIVGQAAPFMEATYLSEKVENAQDRVSGLNNTLNGIVSTVSDTAQEGRDYANQLRTQYQEEWEQVSQNLAAILDSISENEAATEQYRENIRHAMETIASEEDSLITEGQESLSDDLEELKEQGLLPENTDLDDLQDILERNDMTVEGLLEQIRNNTDSGEELLEQIRDNMEYGDELLEQIRDNMDSEEELLAQIIGNRISGQTEESAQRIRDQLQIINDNLQLIQGQYEIDEENEEELRDSLREDMQNSSRAEDVDQFVEIIEQGSKAVSDGMNSAVSQINDALDAADEELAVLREGNFIEDISVITSDPDAKGMISGCINSGTVNGDINVGGIAGTMNIEYGSDPERDFSFAGDADIVLRATMNDVIMDCTNLGTVQVKKNHAGGIVGGQLLGLVYSCEAYGYVIASAGDELGGIAGYSEAAVRGCFSLCSIEGKDRIGGICGYGSTLENCISICELQSEGECKGAIAGETDGEGNRIGNFFVSDTLEGIDGISYLGIAEHRTYDEIMQMEGIPDDFHQIRITFVAEEEVIEERQQPYGSVLEEKDFPSIPEKEGYYAQWDYDGEMLAANEMVVAEYLPWVEALASEETDDVGRRIMLAAGEFYQGDVLRLREAAVDVQPPLSERDTLLYLYAWEIEMPEKHWLPEEIECHFAVAEPGQTRLYILKDGAWSPIPTEEDGSYLVASLPYGATFALIEENAGTLSTSLIAAGGALLLIVLIAVVRRKRSRSLGKKEKTK